MTLREPVHEIFPRSGICRSLSQFLLLILATALSAHAQRIITLDAPGADLTPGDYNGTFPSAVNIEGAVTGYYEDSTFVYHGFIRTPKGDYVTFEAPGADTTPNSYNGTVPSSISDLGVVVGSYYDASGASHGFLRGSGGEFTTFNVPGQAGISPIAINLEGEVVGYYIDPSNSIHAFLRTPNGKITTWNGPGACTGSNLNGCYGSGASNLNAFGIVVGGYEDANFVHHNFVRALDGELKVFDVPGAGTGAYQGTGCPGCFLGFNQFGAIAGIWSDSNSVNHGFIRNPSGKITTFDAPGAGSGTEQGTGCYSDCPVSINDWGAVTGEYIDANNNYHGYLRSPEGKIVSFDPSGSVFTLSFSINDGGVITGYYADANFVYHGFLRFPD
jgi:hypothetical protein